MRKKNNKKRFEISWEFHWVHLIVLFVLWFVFIRQTRLTMWNPTINIDQQIWSEQTTSDEIVWDNETLNDAEWNESHSAAWYFDEENVAGGDLEQWDEEHMLGNTRWWSEWHYTILDQMPEFEWEDITVCNPNNAAKCFVIMDRNLWATTTWKWLAAPISSNGYYYQYWNNYGFKDGGLITTSSILVDASWYWPWNYYNSWGFVVNSVAPYWWDISDNLNLWWWSWDTWNNRWSWTDEDRQWPCPYWYHIPSRNEWEAAYQIWNTPGATVTYMWNTIIAKANNLGVSKDFSNDLMLPFAGYRSNSDASLGNRGTAYYHSSTNYKNASNIYVYVLESRPNWIYHYYTNHYSDIFSFSTGLPRAAAPSIRCFKNFQVFSLNFESNGGSIPDEPLTTAFRWQDVSLPESIKEWYKFIWWYTTPTFEDDTKVTTNSIVSNWPLTLYAKWKKMWTMSFNTNWWSFVNNQIIEDYWTWYLPMMPIKQWQIFDWWYIDDTLTEEFDFENTIITWDVILYAKWDACPEWYKSINNRCIVNSAWVYYESWVIKITNWETIIYIKDRNQWAEKSLLDSENFKAQQLIEKIDFEIWKLSCQNDAEWCPENTYLDIINRILNKNFENIAEADSYLQELENASYDSEDDISPYYWTFYFWWNNNWATYNELHVNRNEWIIDELLYLRWFDEWKIGEDNTWWWEWENDNPCDISKWEYLPTMSDWKETFDIWWEINWMENKYEEWEYIPILFFNDILALNWYFTTKPWHHCQRQMCYENNNRNLLTLLFSTPVYAYEDKRIVFYWNFSLWWTDSNISNILEWGLQKFSQSDTDTLNAIAAPVRCFIKSYNVNFNTDWWSAVEKVEVVWNQIIQEPDQPKKLNYTFWWWYTDSWFVQKYDFSQPVSSDLTLYAKWEKNNMTSWNWWGGGWSSLKKDNCPNGDYSDSYYDWKCWTQKIAEDEQKISEDSPTKPQSNKTWHNSADEVVYDTLRFNPHYSDEMNRAYQFAYHYGITTKTNIKDAAMNWELTRIAMAKMLSQYAINVLWIQPDKSRNNQFADVSDKLDTEYDDWVTLAYQLWIMWINMPNNEFKPYNYVTRAEFATALSRLLYHTSDWMFEKTSRYYVPHINKLAYEWILTNTDPAMKELRWYVMLMLMRSAK